jgi:RNA polymerase sigma-70 factor (ECF subfamily)
MADSHSQEITKLLHDWKQGNQAALDQLIPIIYEKLHRLARGYLRKERADHTLQPTALIHEAYLRLVDQSAPHWENRTHFYAVAAHLMRQILVDHARKRQAGKRGGAMKKVSLDPAMAIGENEIVSFLRLDDLLSELTKLDERKARVLELKHFGGLTIEETAESLGVSAKTVGRDLRMAEAWLKREMTKFLA